MVTFRPVTEADLPLLHKWMEGEHWQKWWKDVDTELGYIQDMMEGRDTTRPFIFQVDGEDAGYIQLWSVADQKARGWREVVPWFDLLPDEAVGIDVSIGEREKLSKGLGTEVLKAFVAKLRGEGKARILVDPEKSNPRAIKCYRKAGFREVESLLGKTGHILIMEHTRQEGVS
ncbi:GNAT family N-acetyltransferase [Roseibium sp. RKSG952]|uniref:GNAT family N-acetyltransferase n=1 Tax=Roseibium sp. RKSG952 TaxID=2529384 RepID=UPI0012BB768D|nr:GNAT family N-acetyltransferase [Roseibium sp. RKSG952]MTH99741.1 GNAT family N-acetyltransferase [Roseibium sp. RKSG952]